MKIRKWTKDFGWVVEREGNETLGSLPAEKTKELLNSGGVVIIRGFDVDQEQFVGYTNLFSKNGFLKHANPTLRKTVSADQTVAEVLEGNNEVELHGEMYYRPWRPDCLWLYCIKPADFKGGTTICDGQMFLRELSKDTVKFFREHKLKYTNTLPANGWQAATNVTNVDEALQIIRNAPGMQNVKKVGREHIALEFVTSAFTRTRTTNEEAFINSVRNILQYEYLNKIFVNLEDGTDFPESLLQEMYEVGQRILKPIDWQPNDIAVVDNSRMLHGREKFEGPRKIYTRFSSAA
jgi:alpha-ketoglutarate-dependent taurine dioxygenase